MTGYRGYRCVVPDCLRRVGYHRLMCDPCWRTVPVELREALWAALRDARAKRPGARARFSELRQRCHQAALTAAVAANNPQTGDEAAVLTQPPAVPPPSRPAEPRPAASSPPLPGEPGYDVTSPSQPESPGTASGGTVGADGEVLEVPGDSTGASTQGEPAAAPDSASGPSAPTTQTPAPDLSAGSASPTAREQAGEEGAPGGRPAAPSEPPQRQATGHG